ncbi:MAG: Gp15 family bacteriophage protein [Phycisphaerae bacterium]
MPKGTARDGMRLDYALDNQLEIYGKQLDLNLAFDVVLRVDDLQGSQELDIDKIDVSLRLLVKNYKSIQSLPIAQKQTIRNEIFDRFIDLKLKPSPDGVKTVDFKQDAVYIYSSFMMDYGIDLYEAQGKLDWRKFISLFLGLSERTKIKEITAIRSRKIPAATKYNAEERAELQKLKLYYALEVSEVEAHGNVQKGIAKLFGALSARAKRGEK